MLQKRYLIAVEGANPFTGSYVNYHTAYTPKEALNIYRFIKRADYHYATSDFRITKKPFACWGWVKEAQMAITERQFLEVCGLEWDEDELQF